MTTHEIVHNIVPANDKWFNLTVDNDVDPMEVVSSAGYNAKGWKYLGPELKDKQTYRVKLVRLGHIRNTDEAQKKVNKMGCRLIEGQAREAFKAKFPRPDGNGYIVFGGSEWQSPDGYACVTYLHDFQDGWRSRFRWRARVFRRAWRWLVVGK